MSKKTMQQLIMEYQKKQRQAENRSKRKSEEYLKEQEIIRSIEEDVEFSKRIETKRKIAKNVLTPQDTYLGDSYGDWIPSKTNGIKFAKQLCTFGGIRQ